MERSPKHVRLRLYLDENFPAPAGLFLKNEHQSVSFTKKKDKGNSDEDQMKAATKEKRILVSLDKDFKVNDNLKGLICKSMGVVLINCSQTDSENIINIFKKHLHSISNSEIKGRICRISIDKYEIEEIRLTK